MITSPTNNKTSQPAFNNNITIFDFNKRIKILEERLIKGKTKLDTIVIDNHDNFL